MTLVFVTEARFRRSPEGKIYSITGTYNLTLWNRYLSVFEKIVVIARIEDTIYPSSDMFLSSSNKVTFVPLPYYVGMGSFLKNRNKIIKVLKGQAISGRSYICRVPGVLGEMFSAILKEKEIKYGVEVVGDPWDVFTSGAFNNPLAPIVRIYSYLRLRKTVRNASAVLYVTKQQLQKRYPPRNGVYITNASNVILGDHLIVDKIRNFDKNQFDQINLLSVGYLDQMYKAPDIAIDAIKILLDRGVNCTLTWVGDGLYKNAMVQYALQKGVGDRVLFVGRIPPEQVREYLLNSDIFIHVSRAEGLPRAVIEAMGVGLPCIGTRVGGIPELLDTKVLVEPNDSVVVADMIDRFIIDNEFTNLQAKRNLEESKYYMESILRKRREEFYKKIITITHEDINIRQAN